MSRFECTPTTPWGFHPVVRNDEDCPRCGWTAPGPRGDARREAERMAASPAWALIACGTHVPEARAA